MSFWSCESSSEKGESEISMPSCSVTSFSAVSVVSVVVVSVAAISASRLLGGGDTEEAGHLAGEHEIALDLELARHEHRRAGLLAGDQLQEGNGRGRDLDLGLVGGRVGVDGA